MPNNCEKWTLVEEPKSDEHRKHIYKEAHKIAKSQDENDKHYSLVSKNCEGFCKLVYQSDKFTQVQTGIAAVTIAAVITGVAAYLLSSESKEEKDEKQEKKKEKKKVVQ